MSYPFEGAVRPLIGRMHTPARTLLSLMVVTGAAVAPLGAQQQQAPQPRQHEVRAGETLWGLAQFYFTNPYLWPVIFEANRTVVEDPHWIYPGEVLAIPAAESGLPVAVQQPGVEEDAPAPVRETLAPAQGQRPGGRTRFYSEPPPPNQEREIALITRSEPLYAVPPAEYLSAPWFADSSAVGIRGRLVGMADPSRQNDKLPPLLHPNDEVLLGSLRGDAFAVGDSVLVVRFDRAPRGFGQIVLPVAMLRVDSIGESVANARLVRQYRNARVGDWLLSVGELPSLARGEPRPVSGGAEGRLVKFLDEDPLYGAADLAFIDLGRGAGVNVGDELIAFVPVRPGTNRVALPPEIVGTLRVVRVNESSSTVRVTNAVSTALGEGVAVRVVRSMQ